MENIFYPPALWIAALLASQATNTPNILTTTQSIPKAPTTVQPTAKASTIAQFTAKASAVAQLATKASAATQPANVGTIKVTSEPTKAPKKKEVSKGKEVENSEPPSATKIDPPPSIGN